MAIIKRQLFRELIYTHLVPSTDTVDICMVLQNRFCKISAIVRFNERQQSNVTILTVRA